MNDIRIAHVEMKPDNQGKIIATIAVGLMILAGGVHTHANGWWKAPPKPIVAANQLPQITPPIVPGMSKPSRTT